MPHYSQSSSDPDLQSTRRRSQRLVSLSSNSQEPSGVLPSSSYDLVQSSSQLEKEHFSSTESTEGESGNLIPPDHQQLPPHLRPSIIYAETAVTENFSRVDSTLSSNPVLSRDAPSTSQTTPSIGTGSPSYAHHGSDALAEGNVELLGEGDTFPKPTFDRSIFRHVIRTKANLRIDHHWAHDMIGSQFAYKQGELDDCDLTSSSASSSPDDLIQQLELQIFNQDVIQN